MNSFISFFKESKGFLWALVIVLCFELFLGLYPKTDYIDPTGVFYTTLKKEIAETKNDFDYIMLGDSRSLSIRGKKPEGNSPSFYNFSLPAAGTRYLKYFVAKYLEHNARPKAIIFALDPEQFRPAQQTSGFNVDTKIWALFKHRLLNLFSISENLQQYEGKEAYFIFKEALPNIVPSVRHRDGLDKTFTGMKGREVLEGDFPYYKSNTKLAELTNETYGQVNLGTYLEIPPGITLDMIQETVDSSVKILNQESADLQTLDEFLDYCENLNIPVILLEVPHAEGFTSTRLYKEVRLGFLERADKRKNVHWVPFPDANYPLDHFAEGIHFNEKGEVRVNRDFDNHIWPKILQLP
ncbi:DUF1574 family protein [Leptospira sp. GIMC2001]|uniref:DUF1574 family protein n=1 Tax=Leptospira sp. GIMC2001 TaxID=1513297 RepID=UPI002349021E|nr:DUF1574 family protein [Leptospira sp. GIMC2001]WCL50873.1 DUF1574 family protein [Leptospira sp. GIMC2001]